MYRDPGERDLKRHLPLYRLTERGRELLIFRQSNRSITATKEDTGMSIAERAKEAAEMFGFSEKEALFLVMGNDG